MGLISVVPEKIRRKMLKLRWFFSDPSETPTTVTFTGGLGAQILSLAIVLDLRGRGVPVSVDLSYFSQAPSVAELGGSVSIWTWALDAFGFPIEAVENLSTVQNNQPTRLLSDSKEKFELGLAALGKESVCNSFPSKTSLEVFELLGLPQSSAATNYAVFHLRRGDYLNVSSHVVSEEEYLHIVPRIAGLAKTAIVCSDSELSAEFHEFFGLNFESVVFLEGHSHDAILIHHLLRNAPIHVGSNGSFSMTAGLLGKGLWLSPGVWFGKESDYDEVLNNNVNFAVRLLPALIV